MRQKLHEMQCDSESCRWIGERSCVEKLSTCRFDLHQNQKKKKISNFIPGVNKLQHDKTKITHRELLKVIVVAFDMIESLAVLLGATEPSDCQKKQKGHTISTQHNRQLKRVKKSDTLFDFVTLCSINVYWCATVACRYSSSFDSCCWLLVAAVLLTLLLCKMH